MLRNQKHGPRIALAEPPFEPDVAAAIEPLGPPIALFRAFARRPDRARAIHGWGEYYFSRRSALTLRQRELVIHRTTARCGAEYEWAIHASLFASKVGLGQAELHSTVRGSGDDLCWSAEDRALLRAVDALHDDGDLDDARWADLVGAVGEEGAIDVMLVAGWYHAISYVARALRLELEPGTPGFPAADVPEAS